VVPIVAARFAGNAAPGPPPSVARRAGCTIAIHAEEALVQQATTDQAGEWKEAYRGSPTTVEPKIAHFVMVALAQHPQPGAATCCTRAAALWSQYAPFAAENAIPSGQVAGCTANDPFSQPPGSVTSAMLSHMRRRDPAE
jgi:hypothetical protein